MNCKICSNHSFKIFDAQMLQKYKSDYFQCNYCNFIQTGEPYWLAEAYTSAITAIDVGLVYRNMTFSDIIPDILEIFSSEHDSYLDYGGGYGMFVRIMRDKGYDFYLHDIYAENVYAKYFELEDFKGKRKFAALTTFEVFEHIVNPLEEIEKMFSLSDTIIFSTELQPSTSSFNCSSEWWYFMPETGQHIAFYSKKSLEVIRDIFSCNLYSNGSSLHILTKLNLSKDPFAPKAVPKLNLIERMLNRLHNRKPKTKIYRNSLLQKDFELYKKKLLISSTDALPSSSS